MLKKILESEESDVGKEWKDGWESAAGDQSRNDATVLIGRLQ